MSMISMSALAAKAAGFECGGRIEPNAYLIIALDSFEEEFPVASRPPYSNAIGGEHQPASAILPQRDGGSMLDPAPPTQSDPR